MIVFFDLPEELEKHREDLKVWLNAVADTHSFRIKELQYHIVDDGRMLEVNRRHLDHDFDTDVITFGYGNNHTIKGEVFLNKDFIERSAKSLGFSMEYEFARIMAHGLLHLCGYDDTTVALKEQMTKEEDNALSLQTFFKPKFHVEQ